MHNGNTTFIKILKSPAPSIFADSSRLSGIVPIYVRITIILNALIMDGKIYTQKLFSRCRSLIRK
ncbi:hypothetical protein D3C80_1784070 [compost metagenome]